MRYILGLEGRIRYSWYKEEDTLVDQDMDIAVSNFLSGSGTGAGDRSPPERETNKDDSWHIIPITHVRAQLPNELSC